MKTLQSILLVEDDTDDQETFVYALREMEKVILYDIVNNGKEALDWLEKTVKLPTLIFMDIHMPVMNGIECLKEIVKNPRTKNIPVFILSTDTRQAEVVLQLGAKLFFEKSWNGKTLRDQLKQILNTDFIIESKSVEQTFQIANTAF
jgi:CheY-like chemotaxis protein